MASRQFVMLCKESSYGTPMASPVKGTDLFYARLHDGDSYTGMMVPRPLDIQYGGGLATPAVRVNDQFELPFQFKTYLYPGAFSAFLLNWCMVNINTGRTTPWVTTDATYVMPPGDLASVSIYQAIMRNDGTYDRRMHNGCKVHSWTITCSRQEPRALLTINGFGIRDDYSAAGHSYPDATEFPAPLETDYPTAPYLFSGTAGNLVVDSSTNARSLYDNVSLTVNNIVDRQFFEAQYQYLAKFCGRNSTLNATVYIKPTPDDLAWLQTQQVLNASLKFSNGVNTLKVDMKGHNYINAIQRATPNNAIYKYSMTIGNLYDASASADIALTTT